MLQEIREYMAQMISKLKSYLAAKIVQALYTKYDKNFVLIQLPKLTIMPLKQDLLIIRLLWTVWQSNADVYQLNRACIYAGIMLHDLAKVIGLTGPDQTEYTVKSNWSPSLC